MSLERHLKMLAIRTLRQELGIGNKDLDADLIRALRHATGRARQQTGRNLHWGADNFTALGGTRLRFRSVGHQLRTGTTVRVAESTATTDITGDYEITKVDQDTFTIELAETIADTDGWTQLHENSVATIHPLKQVTARPVDSRNIWIPQSALPWLQPTAVGIWNGEEFEEIDSENWYVEADEGVYLAGRICPVDLSWDVPYATTAGRMGLKHRSRDRNYQITYWAGAADCPPEIEMAVLSTVADLMELQGGGKDRQSESHEGSSVSRMSGSERFEHLLSPTNIFTNWRAR